MTTTVPTTLMRRGYVDVGRGQLQYRSAGTGPKTVLLLHQTASSGAMFDQDPALVASVIRETGIWSA